MRKAHIDFPVLLDNPMQVWRLDEVDVLPVTFIINPTGKVVKKIYGPSTEASLVAVLSALSHE